MMKRKLSHKVINKSGGLTIPAAIRREHNNFLSGEAVDLKVEDGKLIIAPHTPKCIFCGSFEGVIKYSGRYVCKKCSAGIAREVEAHG